MLYVKYKEVGGIKGFEITHDEEVEGVWVQCPFGHANSEVFHARKLSEASKIAAVLRKGGAEVTIRT